MSSAERPWWARVLEGVALVAAGTGIVGVIHAVSTSSPPAAQATASPMTSAPLQVVDTSSVGSWAVLPMGNLSEPDNTFWQLFYRAPGSAGWVLSTPPAVADNGGVVVSVRSDGTVEAGVLPSQMLLNSPIATTSDDGSSWSTSIIEGGLADLPDSLALDPAGASYGLLGGGKLVFSGNDGKSWAELAKPSSRPSCHIKGLTAVTSGPGGVFVGAVCSHGDQVGIFERSADGWALTGPMLPRSTGSSVLRLVDGAAGLTALVSVPGATSTSIYVATNSTGEWTLSSALEVPSDDTLVSTSSAVSDTTSIPAASFGVLVQSPAGALTFYALDAPAGTWQAVSKVPSGTEDVEIGPSSGYEALAVDGSKLQIWSTAARSSTWQKISQQTVPIQYGSSS